jgi:hypothetical protein
MKNYTTVKVDVKPAAIEFEGGLTIFIDENNNIKIEGQKNVDFNCNGDLNFNAQKINMVGKDEVTLESKMHLIHLAPRIDLNPDTDEPRYKEHKELVEKFRKEKSIPNSPRFCHPLGDES